ncbi:hypothetical protein IQ270_29105 [Microcoleus sp. LEGE 07076]|nr:hypothetical protein [Microcoleus sp. LEGE 07076]MBE9188581.1 hypothetical protein [Microcoleus sp. LEGE 07076]
MPRTLARIMFFNQEGSPGTLYGGKGFLIPLLTSELTSQSSPNLRGF